MQEILDHVTRQVALATPVDEPFPHIVVPNVFPADLWQALKDALPDRSGFEFVGYSTWNLYRAVYRKLSREHLELADLMEAAHEQAMSAIMRRMMLKIAMPYVHSFCPDYDGPVVDADTPFEIHPPHFKERVAGFQQKAHLDGAFRLMACYYYMTGPEPLAGLGTQLYRTTGTGAGYSALRNMFSRQADDVTVETATTMDFTDNTLFCFGNAEHAWHGVPLLTEENLRGQRRLSLGAYVVLPREFVEMEIVARGLRNR